MTAQSLLRVPGTVRQRRQRLHCLRVPSMTAAQSPRPARRRLTTGSGEDIGAKPVLVTEAKGRGLKSRSEDYSHLDWVPREKLTAAQLAETGPYCSGAYIEPIRPGMNDKTNKSDAPTFIGAKASRYKQDEQIATLAGDVVLRQGSMQVEADEANLYQAESRGELNGNVRIRDNGALIVGDHAEVQLDTGEAKVDNAEYVMHKSRIRGNALYAKRAENAIIRLKDGTYTTCEPNSNAWQLKGNNITLNPATGFGTATNVTLRVKDIPVLYTPYIYFPIDDRRQSGFLPPTIGTGSDTGFAAGHAVLLQPGTELRRHVVPALHEQARPVDGRRVPLPDQVQRRSVRRRVPERRRRLIAASRPTTKKPATCTTGSTRAVSIRASDSPSRLHQDQRSVLLPGSADRSDRREKRGLREPAGLRHLSWRQLHRSLERPGLSAGDRIEHHAV